MHHENELEFTFNLSSSVNCDEFIIVKFNIMYLCACLVHFFLIAKSYSLTNLSKSELVHHRKYARIMTTGNDDQLNPLPPIPSIIPPYYPSETTQNTILTPSPTMPPRNGGGAAKVIEKCREYHDWLIKRSTFQFFIIKGTPVIQKEFPHMAALGYGSENNIQWLCGGSLISEQYVLTAAHCLKSMEMGLVSWIKLGDNNLSSVDSETAQMFTVKERIPHPDYTSSSKYNDIALIKLERPVVFSEYVLPICISTSESDVNERLIATGWGNTKINGPRSNILMKVNLDFFPNNVCRKAYADASKKDLPDGVLADRQICAGSKTDQRDTCQGDSGGPLQINTDKLYLIGITSIGKMCGQKNVPAIYTRVLHYIPWIEQIVWSG